MWDRALLTFCIRESVSTMFFSTWSAFFCRRSMSSVSSLLEMLGRERGARHPTKPATAPGGAVTPRVAGGQPSLQGTAAVCDSLLPSNTFQNTQPVGQEGVGTAGNGSDA